MAPSFRIQKLNGSYRKGLEIKESLYMRNAIACGKTTQLELNSTGSDNLLQQTRFLAYGQYLNNPK